MAAGERRGGVAGIVLTHRHLDHAGGGARAARAVRRAAGAGRSSADPPSSGFEEPSVEGLAPDVALDDGDTFGPFEVIATPGHSPDHLSFVADRVAVLRRHRAGRGQRLHPARRRRAARSTWSRCSGCAQLDARARCAPGTVRSCGIRPRSSTSTSSTASTASDRLRRRARRAACAHKTSCSTRCGTTRPRHCARGGAHARGAPGEAGGRGPAARGRASGSSSSRRSGITGTGSAPSGSPTASSISSSIP